MRDSFIFYRSFFESFSDLSKKDKLILFEAVCNYALNDIETQLSGAPSAMFKLLKPQLDANTRKYENGCKGGRPKKNLEETKTKPNHNLPVSKPKRNDNDNDNDNDNVNENVSGSGNTDVWSLSFSVLSHLNQVAGTNFKTNEAASVRLISELSHSGYSESDMRSVIDKKCADWLGNPVVERYLRPSTLFGPKFAEYLAQPSKAVAEKKETEQRRAKAIEDNEAKRSAYDNELRLIGEKIKNAPVQDRIRLRERQAWLEDEIRRLTS